MGMSKDALLWTKPLQPRVTKQMHVSETFDHLQEELFQNHSHASWLGKMKISFKRISPLFSLLN